MPIRERLRLAAKALAASLLATLVLSAPLSAQTATTASVRLDSRRAADLATSSEGSVALDGLLRSIGSVQLRSDRPMVMLLHVLHLRRGDVLRAYRSPSFRVPAGGRVWFRDVLQPGQPEYGNVPFAPENVVQARRSVPADRAIDDAWSHVIDGVFFSKPEGWRRMDAFYVVAVPADDRQARTAVVGPAVVFAMPMPDY